VLSGLEQSLVKICTLVAACGKRDKVMKENKLTRKQPSQGFKER
jgi:hypothetical protein